MTTLTSTPSLSAVVGLTRGLVFACTLIAGAACSGQTQSGAAGGQPTTQAVTPPVVAASVAAVASAPPSVATRKWNFDGDQVGGLPSGAQPFGGEWAVRAEPDAPSPPNALCQTGNADFPAIGLDDKPYTDLTIVAHFKPISGKTDQAGGLIFRVQDKGNYYILRGNALEDNVIFFTYVNAQRSQLKGANAKVTPNTWHELRVEVRGNRFVGSLDGKQVVDSTDSRYTAGGIGLWTKSDSVTCFDDVEVTA